MAWNNGLGPWTQMSRKTRSLSGQFAAQEAVFSVNRGDDGAFPCLRRNAPPPQASSLEKLRIGRLPEVGMVR